MNRRGLLGAILAMGAAPALVSAGSLMKVAAPLDDAARFERALRVCGRVVGGVYRIDRTIALPSGPVHIEGVRFINCHPYGMPMLRVSAFSGVTLRDCSAEWREAA